MKLMFMRHAAALDRAEWRGEDALRPLTTEGAANTAKAAARLAEIGVKPNLIVSSPLVRARETARIIGAAFTPPIEPIEDQRLAPGFDETALDELIEELREDQEDLKSVLFVGHEPDFGLVCGSLSGGAAIAFKKGTLALIDYDPDTEDGRLLWLVPQKLLS